MNYPAPYVADKKVSTNERVWDIWSRLNQDRIIFLGEPINDITANRIVGQLLHLESVDNVSDVYLYINSPGGQITSGMAIYDTMNYIRPDINTVCYGMAASMAAVLLSAGAAGKRTILPNAEVMIHQPRGGTQGVVTDIEISTKRILYMKKKLTKIIADNCGRDYDEVAGHMERDHWLTAEAAKEYGIVDRVVKPRVEEEDEKE
jgi:ATP-dependent Clp protease protease subunit